RRKDELFAEVGLTSDLLEQASSFDLHPALLDGALHVAGLDSTRRAGADADMDVWLPFSWRGVEVHLEGATDLRVRLVRDQPDSVSLALADERGRPVASIEGLR